MTDPTPPHVKVQAVAFLGFLGGLAAAGASGDGLKGTVLAALVIGFMAGLATIIKLELKDADRRAGAEVVREPRSHVEPIEPTRGRRR